MAENSSGAEDEVERHAAIARLVYDLLLRQNQWVALLASLTREFDSTYSVVLSRDQFDHSVQITETDILAPERRHAYETYYSRLLPASFFQRVDFALGEVFTDRLYPDYESYLRSPLYREFFRPLGADHLMFMPLSHGPRQDRSIVIRRSRAVGFYDQMAIRRFRMFGAHIANAESLAARMRAGRSRATNLEAMIAQFAIAAFVTDRYGKIHHMTEAAERLLSSGEVFSVAGGRLTCCQAALERAFKAAVRDAADSLDNPGPKVRQMTCVGQTERGAPLTAAVSAILWSADAVGTVPASLIVMSRSQDQVLAQVDATAALFGLTPAERLLAGSLAVGRPLSEHAALAHISIATARTLLKRVFAKTETHSQAELVGLLLRNGNLVAPGAPSVRR